MPSQYTVFYVPGAIPEPVDIALSHDCCGMETRKTFDQLQLDYPSLQRCSSSDFQEMREKSLRTDPVEITRETFIDQLEVLPPLGRVVRDGAETFKSSEFYSGRITSCYARVNGRYYHLRDVASITHDEILARIERTLSPA